MALVNSATMVPVRKGVFPAIVSILKSPLLQGENLNFIEFYNFFLQEGLYTLFLIF